MFVSWKVNVTVFLDGNIDVAESQVRDFISRAKDAAKEDSMAVFLYDQSGMRVEVETFEDDDSLMGNV